MSAGHTAMIQVEFIHIDVALIEYSLLISCSQAVKSMRPFASEPKQTVV